MSGSEQTRDFRISERRAQIAFLERGWDIYVPLVEGGVDFLAGSFRIQVKCSGVNPRTGSYTFFLGGKQRNRHYPNVDLFVFHARDDDLWFIVPRSKLPDLLPDGIAIKRDGTTTLYSWFFEYEGAWPIPAEVTP